MAIVKATSSQFHVVPKEKHVRSEPPGERAGGCCCCGGGAAAPGAALALAGVVGTLRAAQRAVPGLSRLCPVYYPPQR